MTRWKEWSDDEKSLLMSCRYAKPPIEWAVIQADVFPDRTKASLRQKWYKLQRELGDLRTEKRQKLGPTDRYPPNRRSGVHHSVDVGVVTDHDESYSSESEDEEDTDHEMGVEMVSDCETESDNDFGDVSEDGVMKMVNQVSLPKVSSKSDNASLRYRNPPFPYKASSSDTTSSTHNMTPVGGIASKGTRNLLGHLMDRTMDNPYSAPRVGGLVPGNRISHRLIGRQRDIPTAKLSRTVSNYLSDAPGAQFIPRPTDGCRPGFLDSVIQVLPWHNESRPLYQSSHRSIPELYRVPSAQSAFPIFKNPLITPNTSTRVPNRETDEPGGPTNSRCEGRYPNIANTPAPITPRSPTGLPCDLYQSGPMSIVKQEPSTPDRFIPVAEAPKQTTIINPSRPIDNRENESPSPESPNLQGINNLHTGNEVHKTGPLNVLGILQQVHQEAAAEHLKLRNRIRRLNDKLRMAEEEADQLLECKTKADVLRKKIEQPDSFMPSDFRNLSALLELGHRYGKLTADSVVREQ